VLGVTVELALIVHDHTEVTFKEGGGSWWIFYIGLARSIAVGDSLFVVGNDVVIFDTCKCVVVLEVAVSVLTESFITSHPYSGEVVSIARTIVGRLLVGREEARQSLPGGDALC
jgi:hypothetical protein